MLTQQLLLLDKVSASSTDELRNARKALVKEIQELLEILERRASNTKKEDSNWWRYVVRDWLPFNMIPLFQTF